jgi:hypothetical protein
MLQTTSLHAPKVAPESIPTLCGQAHLMQELSLLLYITHIFFLLSGLLNLLQLILLLFILLVLCDLLHQLLLLPKYLIPLNFNPIQVRELGQP